MGFVDPKVSASLAAEVYVVRDEFELQGFLARKEFKPNKNQKVALSAKVGSRLINTKDAFSVCALGDGQYDNHLFLIFRGTVPKANFCADIATDARIGLELSSTGSWVHIGFNHAFTSMRSEIADFLNKNTQVHTVHCIGHSLGGAVASLAADWVREKFSKKTQLYTFGCPRVGLGFSGFAQKLTTKLAPENIHRVYHSTDPVPMAPIFPYAHAPLPGYGHYVPFGGIVFNFSAHDMANYVASVSGKRWSDFAAPPPTLSALGSIKHWLESDSAISADQATTWQKLNVALEYVFKKIGIAVASGVQLGLLMADTPADKIAMLLHKGIKLSVDAGKWVFHLIRRMMQMLGMKVVQTIQELSEALMRMVLRRILSRLNQEVRKALEHIKH